MPYAPSAPLLAWSGARLATIRSVETAGRGRPLAHAYVLRVVAEFQGFARDLHDLAAEKLVELARPSPAHEATLVTSATEGRWIDRGNADVRNLTADFKRLGVENLPARLAALDARWRGLPGRPGDRAEYADLIRLRNCLAHGNRAQLDRLRREGVLDTVSWTRARLPRLNRIARTLDRVVWNHLLAVFEVEPW